MTKFNFYVETSNGFKGNVVVEKYYDGLQRFTAEAETSFGTIRFRFNESKIYDTSIESIRDYVIMRLELFIEGRLKRSEKELGVKCNNFSEYEIASFEYNIDDFLYCAYIRTIDNREAYEKVCKIKSRMKFEKYGDSVRMVDEDGNWWDNFDDAVCAILEKAGYMVYESDDDE